MCVLALRFYKLFVSPLLGACCRYEPTCSQYAKESIERHGVIRGLRLTVSRLRRCRPGHRGGYDPVPEKEYFDLPTFEKGTR